MILFYSANGKLIKQIPEEVYQGSKVSRIYFVSPYNSNVITVAFKLPNGVYTPENMLKKYETTLVNQVSLQDFFDKNGQEYFVRYIDIPEPVTAWAGEVTVQFFLDNGVATQSVIFDVLEGVPPVNAPAPTNDYNEIKKALSDTFGLVKGLEEDVVTLEKDVVTLEKDVGTLKEDVGTLKEKIENKVDKSELEGYKQTVDNNFTDLKKETKAKIDENANNIKAIYAGLGQANVFVKAEDVENNEPMRITAGGLNVVNGSYTRVKKIQGQSRVSKNLYPISERTSTTSNGLTYTNNGDGTWTVNGTAEGTSGGSATSFYIYNASQCLIVKKGVRYRFSGDPSDGVSKEQFLTFQLRKIENTNENASAYDDNGVEYHYGHTWDKKAFTPNEDCYFTYMIRVAVGQTLSNVVFKPMLTTEAEAIKYENFEPHWKGVKKSTISGIKSTGRNLIPFPYLDAEVEVPKIINDVTFTVLSDGSVKAQGTASNTVYFTLCRADFGNTTVSRSNTAANGKYFVDCNYDARVGNKSTFIRIDKGVTLDRTYYPMVNIGDQALPFEKGGKESIMTLPQPLTLSGFEEWKDGKILDYKTEYSLASSFVFPVTEAGDGEHFVSWVVELKEVPSELQSENIAHDLGEDVSISYDSENYVLVAYTPPWTADEGTQKIENAKLFYKGNVLVSVREFAFDNKYQAFHNGTEQVQDATEHVNVTIINDYIIVGG